MTRAAQTVFPRFRRPPLNPEPAGNEIHVWLCRPDLPPFDPDALIGLLSADERARVLRFRAGRDRRGYIAGRAMVRTIAGRYAGVLPDEIVLNEGKNGKPVIRGLPPGKHLYFSISHADGLALAAFSNKHELGVDVEQVRAIPEMDKIAEQFFSEQEKTRFRALPLSRRIPRFFAWWTRTEAHAKATGAGLAEVLERRESCTNDRSEQTHSGWSVRSLRIGRGYAAALAVPDAKVIIRCHQWRLSARVTHSL